MREMCYPIYIKAYIEITQQTNKPYGTYIYMFVFAQSSFRKLNVKFLVIYNTYTVTIYCINN